MQNQERKQSKLRYDHKPIAVILARNRMKSIRSGVAPHGGGSGPASTTAEALPCHEPMTKDKVRTENRGSERWAESVLSPGCCLHLLVRSLLPFPVGAGSGLCGRHFRQHRCLRLPAQMANRGVSTFDPCVPRQESSGALVAVHPPRGREIRVCARSLVILRKALSQNLCYTVAVPPDIQDWQ